MTPAFIEGLWRDWSPGHAAAEDVAWAVQCLSEPSNAAAAIGYYRALLDVSRHVPAYAEQQAARPRP
ncbi:hypothetical protein [Actinomadura sp. WMMA1423]|uniref:hypothetical protein n=1 Tax=Actinomadura sp. WMMA1423 TaxID=2591108 RepID=UPI00197AC7DE|nr:hypothetical protein [Actinomadura sp. WMMA1423]